MFIASAIYALFVLSGATVSSVASIGKPPKKSEMSTTAPNRAAGITVLNIFMIIAVYFLWRHNHGILGTIFTFILLLTIVVSTIFSIIAVEREPKPMTSSSAAGIVFVELWLIGMVLYLIFG
jgi:hypothetical protein